MLEAGKSKIQDKRGVGCSHQPLLKNPNLVNDGGNTQGLITSQRTP